MRSLLFISLAVLISSCAGRQFRQLERIDPPAYDIGLLDGEFKTVIFKSTLQYKARQLSGLFIAKKMPDQSVKITLAPQVGPKIFDFEITAKNEFIVHYCISFMDRPIVLRMIEKDLRLVLGLNYPIKKTIWRQDEVENQAVLQVKTNKSSNYYFVAYKTGNLAAATKVSNWGRKKVIVDYDNYQQRFPSTIAIQHLHLPLSLNFKLLRKQ